MSSARGSASRGFALEPRYYERYEDQVEDLVAGRARHGVEHEPRPRPHAAADRRRRACAGDARHRPRLAQPDRRARRLGHRARSTICGAAASASATPTRRRRRSSPCTRCAAQGWDALRDFEATRLDRDVGKHGDTGGAELAQLARVRAGELDACVISSVTFDAIERMGDASGLVTVWRSPPFHHCCFTVVRDHRDHERFAELLFSMDAADPKLCEPMELEYVNRWVPFDPDGYSDLIEAVKAGPVVVGEVEVVT